MDVDVIDCCEWCVCRGEGLNGADGFVFWEIWDIGSIAFDLY